MKNYVPEKLNEDETYQAFSRDELELLLSNVSTSSDRPLIIIYSRIGKDPDGENQLQAFAFAPLP